jgi:FlaA1/EpsC-like NDP-sugar epimerase
MSFFKTIQLAVKQVLESSKKNFDFGNIGYLPRWLILLFDITLCVIALLITSYIITNVLDKPNHHFDFGSIEVLIVVVNTVFFLFFRTYAGLIRHSSFIDAIKFFLASAGTFFSLLITNFIFVFVYGEILLHISKLIIYFSISFSFLFLFRVLVKQIFESYFNYTNNTGVTKALIYGTNTNAIAVANALKSEIPARFKIVGFVSANKDESKQVLGLPIYSLRKNISVLIRAYKAEALILADKNLSRDERVELVDDCLDHDYKVFRAPLVSDLEDDKNLTNQIQNIQIEDLLERNPIVLDNKLIAKELFNKTVMVTGGAGSIGSEIIRQIANYQTKKIIILDQAETPLYQIESELKAGFSDKDIDCVIADVAMSEKLEHIFKYYKPDIVYHAAAYKHVPLIEKNPSEAIFTNVLGTKNLADLAIKYGIEKFVMVSTDKAVNPSNVMGASKRIAEMYVQSLYFEHKNENIKSTNFITTRFGNVLGSNGSVVPLFKKQIQEGGPLTITHPDIIRYFMTIPEACQLVIEAGAMGNGGEIFIFDMGKAVKIIDLAKKIIKLAGFEPYKDIDIKTIGLRPGEKLYEELLSDESTSLPTYHEKIMIAKVAKANHKELNDNLTSLINYAKVFDNQKMVGQMKKIVPEFKSMNSTFETLD